MPLWCEKPKLLFLEITNVEDKVRYKKKKCESLIQNLEKRILHEPCKIKVE